MQRRDVAVADERRARLRGSRSTSSSGSSLDAAVAAAHGDDGVDVQLVDHARRAAPRRARRGRPATIACALEHALVVDRLEARAARARPRRRRTPRDRTRWPARRARRGCPAATGRNLIRPARGARRHSHAAISLGDRLMRAAADDVERTRRARAARPETAPSPRCCRASASSMRVLRRARRTRRRG